MYQNNINLSLAILCLFLVRNVFGVPGALILAKNQTSISKEAAENTTTIRSIKSSDHPNYGELENSLGNVLGSSSIGCRIPKFCCCFLQAGAVEKNQNKNSKVDKSKSMSRRGHKMNGHCFEVCSFCLIRYLCNSETVKGLDLVRYC